MNKFVLTIDGWKFDDNRQKWYIPSTKTHYFTNILSLNGVKWGRLSSENASSQLNDFVKHERVYQENKFDISLNDMIHKGYIKSIQEFDHIKRENTIRIRYQSKECVLVNLPMSFYSFNVLQKLKKSYSTDGFGWVFASEFVLLHFFIYFTKSFIKLRLPIKLHFFLYIRQIFIHSI